MRREDAFKQMNWELFYFLEGFTSLIRSLFRLFVSGLIRDPLVCILPAVYRQLFILKQAVLGELLFPLLLHLEMKMKKMKMKREINIWIFIFNILNWISCPSFSVHLLLIDQGPSLPYAWP